MAETAHNTARDVFDRQVGALRPRLHLYCARMVGSALEAEDVVQETLVSGYDNWPAAGVRNLEAWLFRIAHNKAIDHIRSRRRSEAFAVEPALSAPETDEPLLAAEMADFALSLFMQLPPLQRSCVLLKDLLDYSLADISALLDTTVGAVKAALHRARSNLRELARLSDDVPARPLKVEDTDALRRYADRFAARDFEALRDMLIADVRLEVVARERSRGAAIVGNYFGNYDRIDFGDIAIGTAEGQTAMTGSDEYGRFIVLLEFRDGAVTSIRDFRYARYVSDSLAFVPFG